MKHYIVRYAESVAGLMAVAISTGMFVTTHSEWWLAGVAAGSGFITWLVM